ncbi:MAG TPA: hypothetical protein VGO40_24495 [Longimicrobium sp.]|nr:hypothetical protein [Longimicrobium sp.]
MRRTRSYLLATTLAAAVLAIGHAAAPRMARASTTAHAWGIGTLGETCGGVCGSQNICCKITIIAPPP